MRRLPAVLLALLLAPAAAPAQVRAPFDAPLVIADEYQQIVKTLDLNGDGWMDAFGWWTDSQYGANPGQGELHGWINDGTGRLVLSWNVPYANGTNDPLPLDVVAVGDVDRDGDDDFVIAAGNPTQVRVYLSNGAAPPTLALAATSPVGAKTVALADFDGDGDLELVAADSGLGIFDIDLANGALVTRTTVATNFVAQGKLIVAELTGDSELDVLLSGTRVHPVVNGQLQPWVQNFALPWGFGVEISLRFDIGDVDGDGDQDLIAFVTGVQGSQPNQYRIVRRTGPGTWVQEPAQSGGPARMLVDVDGDGDLDGVCCGGGGGGPPQRSANTVVSAFRIARNDGTGVFAPAIVIASLGSKAIAGVVDLDHDGDMDLVAGRCVYYAQGPIVEHPDPRIGNALQDARSVVDLDADGDLDFEPRFQDVRRNRGDGLSDVLPLGLPPALPGTARTGDPIAGDWDGDGDVDLLCMLWNAPGLELLRNVGCGSFVSAGFVAGPTGLAYFPASTVDTLCEDVDGDGDLDLVLRTRTTVLAEGNKSAWWSNDGGGNLAWRETFPGQCLSHVADFDSNGIPDLLAMSNGSSSTGYPLSWAPGLGGGAFGAWQALAGSSTRYWIDQAAVTDWDGDGDLDVAEASYTALRPALYRNDGAGGFTRVDPGLPGLYWAHDTPLSAAAGDVDGDGLVDLVFGPLALGRTCAAIVLRSPGNAGWQAPITQAVFEVVNTYGTTSHFTLADPDGDGDPDLLNDRFVRNLREAGDEGGRRLQVHDGVGGQGGMTPLLGACGPFRVGERAQLRLRGLRPGATGFVAVSYPSDPPPTTLGGMHVATRHRLTAQIQFTASGTPGDAPGSGAWSLEYTVPGYSGGRTTCYTAIVEDPDAPSGLARSNRLYVTYGP